jgi:hypothetical protein
MISDIKWKLARFGWWLIKMWASDQLNIDQDDIQVQEIMDAWKCEINQMAEDKGFEGYEFS